MCAVQCLTGESDPYLTVFNNNSKDFCTFSGPMPCFKKLITTPHCKLGNAESSEEAKYKEGRRKPWPVVRTFPFARHQSISPASHKMPRPNRWHKFVLLVTHHARPAGGTPKPLEHKHRATSITTYASVYKHFL